MPIQDKIIEILAVSKGKDSLLEDTKCVIRAYGAEFSCEDLVEKSLEIIGEDALKAVADLAYARAVQSVMMHLRDVFHR